MKIKLSFFGKASEVGEREKELLKRIAFRCPIEMQSISQAGVADSQKCKTLEAEKLFSKISRSDFLVALDQNGKEMTSIEFSKKLKTWLVDQGTVHFVVGGAYGLSYQVLSRANFCLSFGHMTWTRELARLMLCEQIYRALEIDGGSKFHK